MTRTPLEAYEGLMHFARERGPAPLRMAMHAAVAQSFRPSFLHLIKLNFLPEDAADPSVESDVMCAPFCDEIGAGYYEFDAQTRALLLENLQAEYAGHPTPRLESVAEFLLAYLDEQERSIDSTQDRLSQSYIEVERWIALAILEPDQAAEQLAAALKQVVPDAIAAARVNIGGILNVLSTPLLRYPRLAEYALGVQALERGDTEKARRLLTALGTEELQVGTVKLPSAPTVLERWSAQEEEIAYKSCAVVGAYVDREYADRVVQIFSSAGVQYSMHLFGPDGPQREAVLNLIDQYEALVLILPEHRDLLGFTEFAFSMHKDVILLSIFRSPRFPRLATTILLRDPEQMRRELLSALELKEEAAAPYVGGAYVYDVYIHNAPSDIDWVRDFAARLRNELERQLGAALKIARDTPGYAPESAVFVGILSRNYTQWPYARRALDRFLGAGHNAIIPVLKDPLETWPAPFDKVVGYELHGTDRARDIEELATAIVLMLKRLREGEVEVTAGGPAAVYIARSPDDVASERKRLIDTLTGHGISIVEGTPAPGALASVHLLGSSISDAAVLDFQSAAKLGIQHFIWQSPGAEGLRFGSDLANADVFQTSFNDFLVRVVESLSPSPARQVAGNTICLLYDRRDRDDPNLRLMMLYLENGGFEIRRPQLEGDLTQRVQADREAMANSDATILFYGAGDDSFMRLFLRTVRTASDQPLFALYLSEPANGTKSRTAVWGGLLTLGDGGPFRPESLDPLLNRLEARHYDALMFSDGTEAEAVEMLSSQLTAAGLRLVVRDAAPARFEEYIGTILVCIGRGTTNPAFETRVRTFMGRGSRIIPVLLPIERRPLETVYVSTTGRDLRTFREAVNKTLTAMRKRLGRDEDLVIGIRPNMQLILGQLDNSDVFVGIIGFQYGFIPGPGFTDNPKRLSVNEIEYEQARRQRKPCLIFLQDEAELVNSEYVDKPFDRMQEFRDRLRRENIIRSFKNEEDLARGVLEALVNLERHWAVPLWLVQLDRIDLGHKGEFERLVSAIRGSGPANAA